MSESLNETYQYGLQRYIGEYDNCTLNQDDIFNKDAEIDEAGIDAVSRRERRVMVLVQDLDCSDHHVPNSWADFVNRGYSAITTTLWKHYGDDALKKFEYYFDFDTRDLLEYELRRGLSRAYDHTENDLLYFNTTVAKLSDQAVQPERPKSDLRSDLSSLFK